MNTIGLPEVLIIGLSLLCCLLVIVGAGVGVYLLIRSRNGAQPAGDRPAGEK